MAATTPDPERDETLDLLVPPRSRRLRAAAVVGGIVVLVTALVTGSWWPGVVDLGMSYSHADGSRAEGFDGSTSVVLVGRPGPDVPLTLTSLDPPPGWRIVHAGVAAPSADMRDGVAPEDLAALPAALTARSRVVIAWEVDCAAAIELVRADPSMISTSREAQGEFPAGTTLMLRPQTASAHLRMLGVLPVTTGRSGDDLWLSRTPSRDLVVECGLGADEVATLRQLTTG
ncbi:hypothetical protein [Sanguibacter sp. HDW7]|uniref:hypothetical protein n=1 Tax=Sanguibacter sp. HDW7 TaxID=2714931 RepID=UPI001409C544|nr:hypothetical protein [Sanguibacter sp. HDW7]QIK84374.1 hypothetical protein G7063_12670 [Sanguibacter sp. HDW7]